MNLTSTRRADEFSRLLESGTRTDDPVAGPLLSVADALSAMPRAAGPRPEFRVALRQRLVAVATVQGVATTETPLQRAKAAGSSWRVQRRLTALAAGAAVVTGVTGIGLGASRSLPGDPFYGVKRAAEGVQLATTVGTEARGKRHLEFARTRLAEVESLAGHSDALGPVGANHLLAAPAAGDGHAKLIVDTLHAMDVETRAGANDLFEAFRISASTEPLRALNRFSREQYGRLQVLLAELPESAQPSARSSLALLQVIATDTVRAAAATTPAAPGGSGNPAATPPATSSPQPTGGTGTGGSSPSSASTGGPSSAQTSNPLPLPVPSQLSSPISSPTLPTIPPLVSSTPLPTVLPSLPDDLSGITGLLNP